MLFYFEWIIRFESILDFVFVYFERVVSLIVFKKMVVFKRVWIKLFM